MNKKIALLALLLLLFSTQLLAAKENLLIEKKVHIVDFLGKRHECEYNSCTLISSNEKFVRGSHLSSTLSGLRGFDIPPSENALEAAQRCVRVFNKRLTREERAIPGILATAYKCHSNNAALCTIEYVGVSYLVKYVPNKFEVEWDTDLFTSLNAETKQATLEYFCQVDFSSFFKTYKMPPFIPEKYFNSQTGQYSSNPKAVTDSTNTSPLLDTKSHPDKQELPPKKNFWRILNMNFYPAEVPDKLAAVRRFETKDKTVELKIQFTSGDKTNFLARLQALDPTGEMIGTSCPNNISLYEIPHEGLFQVFLVRPDGIAVLTSGYDPKRPTPHLSPAQRAELCALDINRAY